MVGLETGLTIALRVNAQLAFAFVLFYEFGEDLPSRLVELPTLNGWMTEIKEIGICSVQLIDVTLREKIGKELPILRMLKLHSR